MRYEIGDKVRLITSDFAKQGHLGVVVNREVDDSYVIKFYGDTKLYYVGDDEIELVHDRGFEVCKGFEDIAVMPKRKTARSAGYDFCIPLDVDVTILPNESVAIKTGIKAYMQDDEVLNMHIRSSIGIKKHVILPNITGIIDADFYNNPDNEGNITIALRNLSDKPQTFKAGEAVCQGIFTKYLITDDDNATEKRTGGIGSTNS